MYPDLSPVSQMEEAVAELVRVGRADPSLITGKPKSLIQKMFSFFERVGNAISEEQALRQWIRCMKALLPSLSLVR